MKLGIQEVAFIAAGLVVFVSLLWLKAKIGKNNAAPKQ